MRTMSASLFIRQFAQLQQEVRNGIVAVMSHKRVTGYFLSPEDYAEFEDLRAKARKVLHVGNLRNETVTALQTTRMDPRHAALDKLMQD